MRISCVGFDEDLELTDDGDMIARLYREFICTPGNDIACGSWAS